jgi:V8-like Glu-specific endopeptidase
METPISFDKWPDVIHAVKARRTKAKFDLLVASPVTAPRLAKGVRLSRGKGRVDILARTDRVGQHFFPPSVRTTGLDEKKLLKRKIDVEGLAGFRPDHLALRPLPERLSPKLEVARGWRREPGREDDLGEPGTIFAPDTRYVFSDTSFPWCTCGRVQTASGWGSGVMIGPRHMMTASHVINWGPNNTAGWVKFTPLQFDTSEPFGFAYATRIYWWQQVNPSDGVNSNEAAFDYVVCVLDRRLGDITGWMGSRGYSSDWNGGAYWAHIGYPGDMGSGVRPSFHGNGVMDSTIAESTSGRTSFRIMHQNDYWNGQSGGPAFGWWGNEPWPRVVGIYSAINWGMTGGPNANGGGNPLPELINYARTVEP